jgi:hypothetical protein
MPSSTAVFSRAAFGGLRAENLRDAIPLRPHIHAREETGKMGRRAKPLPLINNDFIILVTMVTQISLPLAGGRRKERTMVNFLMVTDYDTRQKPSEVRWHGNIGYITIDGTLWGEVEWSKTRKAWCIQDAQGRCLSHTDHIHASEADKEAAIALAKAMIRDGRMPDPRTAMQIRARREKGLNREQNLKQVKRILGWLGF